MEDYRGVIYLLAATLIILQLTRWSAIMYRAVSIARKHPGGFTIILFSPFRTASYLLEIVFPPPGWLGHYATKFEIYKKKKATTLLSVQLTGAHLHYWTADPVAFKQVIADRFTFLKDIVPYDILEVWGPNIVTVEGNAWKRHHSIAQPAFSEVNTALAWSETVRVFNDWFAEKDRLRQSSSDVIAFDAVKVFKEGTLLVLSSATFGRPLSWSHAISDEEDDLGGRRLPFAETISQAVDRLLVKLLVPRWLIDTLAKQKVGFAVSTNLVYSEMEQWLLHYIKSVREQLDPAEVKKGRDVISKGSLLRRMVEANMSHEDDGHMSGLSDRELLSDAFVVLLAGHETSSHALAFAFAHLALYPKYQEELYRETLALWPDGLPSESQSQFKIDYSRLEYTLAFFRETLRLFPVEPRLVKTVAADTSLAGQLLHEDGTATRFDVMVPKDSFVVMDIASLHNNPLHWGDDADEFRPDRFIDTETNQWPRDAFAPFFGGPRGCIGSRFALAESICTLAMFVRNYEVQIPSRMATWTHEQQSANMLKWKTGLAMTPLGANVELKRRS